VVCRRSDRRGRVGRVLHPERIEQFLTKHRVPVRSARSFRDNAAGEHMRDVGVGEGGAEARHRLDIAQRVDHRSFIEADEAERIVRIGRQPRALGEKIEHAKLAGDPRVPELEFGIKIDDAIIPLEFAAIDHDAHGCREERLGGGTDLENRARINGRAAALAAHAEPLGVDETVARDDADREPGHAERLHRACGVSLEIGNEHLDACFHGGIDAGGLRLRCRGRE
jgi:hypothetical protein